MSHSMARLAALVLLLPWMAGVRAAPDGTAPATPAAQVMVVGTWHFASPDLDIHNMKSVDVLTPARQAEIVAVVDALARFRPTVVALESPAGSDDDHYGLYRQDKFKPVADERVQLGYRLARQVRLDRVLGIDLPGEFPMDKVAAWAAAHGKGEAFGALMAQAGAMVAASGRQLERDSIGDVLRTINEPAEIAKGQSMYLELLRYGVGEEQPGAELNAAWQRRNYRICARLLQSVSPGDRAVVFFGQGHAHALRRCVIEAPGVDLVEANDFLPR